MFFTPLYRVVPIEAAAPALVIVGALLVRQIAEIDLREFRVVLPAFLTIVVMPFTYSIANGIGAGFIATCCSRRRPGGRGRCTRCCGRWRSRSSATSRRARCSRSSSDGLHRDAG